MRPVAEYRKNAAECRKMAKEMSTPAHRALLEKMAKSWDRSADQREKDPQPEN